MRRRAVCYLVPFLCCVNRNGNPSVCFADSSPYTGAPWVVASAHTVLFNCCANRNGNPSVCSADSSPYTGEPRVVASAHAVLLRRSAKLQTQLGTYNYITLYSFCRARTPQSGAFRSFPPHIRSPGDRQFRCHPKVRGSHLHRRCFQVPNSHCGSASV